jgi:hypothetical protein
MVKLKDILVRILAGRSQTMDERPRQMDDRRRIWYASQRSVFGRIVLKSKDDLVLAPVFGRNKI